MPLQGVVSYEDAISESINIATPSWGVAISFNSKAGFFRPELDAEDTANENHRC